MCAIIIYDYIFKRNSKFLFDFHVNSSHVIIYSPDQILRTLYTKDMMCSSLKIEDVVNYKLYNVLIYSSVLSRFGVSRDHYIITWSISKTTVAV